MSVHIEVPATLSNLGPGYDVLGLAIDRCNRFLVRPGSGSSPGSELVLRTIERAAERFGGSVPALEVIVVEEQVPRARGQGSSATARVAGVLAYRHFVAELDDAQALDFLTEEEGHPDNAAPALLGGLVVCGAQVVPLPIAPVEIALCVPAIEVSTPLARRVLPTSVLHEDAVHNLTALGQLLAGLVTGDLAALRRGVADRLHQPFRAPLIGREQVTGAFEAASAQGAAPFISGSGSTLAAFCAPGTAADVAQAMAGAFPSATASEARVRTEGALALPSGG